MISRWFGLALVVMAAASLRAEDAPDSPVALVDAAGKEHKLAGVKFVLYHHWVYPRESAGTGIES